MAFIFSFWIEKYRLIGFAAPSKKIKKIKLFGGRFFFLAYDTDQFKIKSTAVDILSLSLQPKNYPQKESIEWKNNCSFPYSEDI